MITLKYETVIGNPAEEDMVHMLHAIKPYGFIAGGAGLSLYADKILTESSLPFIPFSDWDIFSYDVQSFNCIKRIIAGVNKPVEKYVLTQNALTIQFKGMKPIQLIAPYNDLYSQLSQVRLLRTDIVSTFKAPLLVTWTSTGERSNDDAISDLKAYLDAVYVMPDDRRSLVCRCGSIEKILGDFDITCCRIAITDNSTIILYDQATREAAARRELELVKCPADNDIARSFHRFRKYVEDKMILCSAGMLSMFSDTKYKDWVTFLTSGVKTKVVKLELSNVTNLGPDCDYFVADSNDF